MTHEEEIRAVNLAKGDLSLFKPLYDTYFSKILSYTISLVGDIEMAKDVVSETFRVAMENLYKYEDRGYSFGAWLFKIAHNLSLKSYKFSKNSSLDEDWYVNEPTKNNSDLETGINIDNLNKAIQKLIRDEREVIILRYIEGFSIEETASILNKTVDSVKSTAKRAFINLRTSLTI